MKRKCNFCNNEGIYICDFRWDELIEIAGCEEHKELAIYKQESHYRFNLFTSKYNQL